MELFIFPRHFNAGAVSNFTSARRAGPFFRPPSESFCRLPGDVESAFETSPTLLFCHLLYTYTVGAGKCQAGLEGQQHNDVEAGSCLFHSLFVLLLLLFISGNVNPINLPGFQPVESSRRILWQNIPAVAEERVVTGTALAMRPPVWHILLNPRGLLQLHSERR